MNRWLPKRCWLAFINLFKKKDYNPINQILGYLISGDPAYITSYNNARSDIRRLERDDLIEELLKEYAKAKQL